MYIQPMEGEGNKNATNKIQCNGDQCGLNSRDSQGNHFNLFIKAIFNFRNKKTAIVRATSKTARIHARQTIASRQ